MEAEKVKEVLADLDETALMFVKADETYMIIRETVRELLLKLGETE